MPIKLDPNDPADAVLLKRYPTGFMPTRPEALREALEEQERWEASLEGREIATKRTAWGKVVRFLRGLWSR